MRTQRVAGIILLSFAMTPATALAVCPAPPSESVLEAGEVGLFFDAAGTRACADVAVGVPTPLYLVARAPEGGIGSYSLPHLAATRLPPGVGFVASSTQLPVPSDFELNPTADWCDLALPLDPGGCAVAEGELVVLGVTSILAVTGVSGTAQFATECPTFAGMRPEPVWYEACGSTQSQALAGGDRLVLGFGEPPVGGEVESWSTVKARFEARR